MKGNFTAFAIAAILVFCSPSNAQSQPTHNTRQSTAPNFGTWNDLVVVYKRYFLVLLPKIKSEGFGTGIALSTNDYKQWTNEDLLALATSYNGYEMFETLIILKNAAIGNGTVQNRQINERQKLDAQNALTELAPSGMTWKKFFNVISDLQEETQSQRQKFYVQRSKAKR